MRRVLSAQQACTLFRVLVHTGRDDRAEDRALLERLLCVYGADALQAPQHDDPPAIVLLRRQQLRLCRLLVECGADVNAEARCANSSYGAGRRTLLSELVVQMEYPPRSRPGAQKYRLIVDLLRVHGARVALDIHPQVRLRFDIWQHSARRDYDRYLPYPYRLMLEALRNGGVHPAYAPPENGVARLFAVAEACIVAAAPASPAQPPHRQTQLLGKRKRAADNGARAVKRVRRRAREAQSSVAQVDLP